MHNCSHCQIRLSNHLFRLLSSFILCGFVFQGCLGHFFGSSWCLWDIHISIYISTQGQARANEVEVLEDINNFTFHQIIVFKKIRSWQVCPGQVVAGRMGLLITILLCLVNIFNVINNNSPSVKVADTSNWFHIHLSRLGALSCY